jgi:hypothetical protein
MAMPMIVTEAEASKMWCPKSFIVDDGSSMNRATAVDFPHQCKCLGSRCMWWMWFDGSKVQGVCGAVNWK